MTIRPATEPALHDELLRRGYTHAAIPGSSIGRRRILRGGRTVSLKTAHEANLWIARLDRKCAAMGGSR